MLIINFVYLLPWIILISYHLINIILIVFVMIYYTSCLIFYWVWNQLLLHIFNFLNKYYYKYVNSYLFFKIVNHSLFEQYFIDNVIISSFNSIKWVKWFKFSKIPHKNQLITGLNTKEASFTFLTASLYFPLRSWLQSSILPRE